MNKKKNNKLAVAILASGSGERGLVALHQSNIKKLIIN